MNELCKLVSRRLNYLKTGRSLENGVLKLNMTVEINVQFCVGG